MKKRILIPAALLGVMLALPGISPAQSTYKTYNFSQGITNSANSANQLGVMISSGTVKWGNGTADAQTNSGVTSSNTFNTYNFGPNAAISILEQGTGNGATAGIYTDDVAGHYNLNNISIIKNAEHTSTAGTSWVGGAVFTGAAAFTGNLQGKTINVESATKTDTYGVRFLNSTDANGIGDINLKTGNSIHFDEISVNATVNGGTAFNAGEVTNGSVTIDRVTSLGKIWAVGAHLQFTEAGTRNGTLKIGEMNVLTTNGGAAGVKFSISGENPELNSSSNNIELGSVNVVGTSAVYGVQGKDVKGLTLTDDMNVTATAVDGKAYGLNGESMEFTAKGDVDINATTAGIKTTTAVKAHIADADLTVSRVDAGEGSIAFDGAGTADLQAVNQTGTGTLNITDGAVVSLNAAGIESLGSGTKTIGVGSGLVINDDANVMDDKLQYFADVKAAGAVDVRSEFGTYALTEDGLVKTSNSPGSLSDGYVAAAGIHQRYTAWNSVRNHMISAASNRGYRGQECDPCDPVCEIDPCDPVDSEESCDSYGSGSFFPRSKKARKSSLARNAWVNYIGRGEEYDAGFNGGKWKLAMDGVQVGTDLFNNRRNQFGVFFGYEGGNMTNGYNRTNTDDFYLGAYAAHVFRNGMDVRASFTYGWQDFDMLRQSVTEKFYYSQFDGRTTETSFEIGKRFFRGAWSLRPVLAIDMMTNDVDGANEIALDGGQAAKNFGKTDMTQTFLRAGADVQYQIRRLAINGGLYFAHDLNDDTISSYVWDSAANQGVTLAGSEPGRDMLMFNIGGSYLLTKRFTVFGGYQGQAVLDSDADAYQSVGYVGGAWKW